MLSWFRKNQKIMLGVFGVGLMFIFTVSLGSGVDPIMDRLSGRTTGGPSTETVVTWDGGQLDTQGLDRLRVQRNMLGRFMGTVMRLSRERGGRQRVSMLPLYSGDRSLLELEILASEAEKLGVEVNDATVIDYLNQLTEGTILPSEYSQILRESTGGNLPENALFPMLARELKAQKVRGLVQNGTFSPIAAWDYYNRLNRLVKAEIMPIAVDDFINQVDEPSEAEVTAMFDKYKRYYPMPMSPEPGFRIREKRAFQYVKVNYDAILESEKATITDEEIQKYYDENKAQYVVEGAMDLSGLPGDETTDDEATTGEGATSETSESATSEADDVPTSEPVTPGESSTETTPAVDAAGTTELDAANVLDAGDATPPGADADAPTPSPTALPQDAVEQATSGAQEVVEQVGEAAANAVNEKANPLRNAAEKATTTVVDSANEAAKNEVIGAAADVTEAVAGAVEEEASETTVESTTTDAVAADVTTTDANGAASTDGATTTETPADEVVDNSDLDAISTYKELSEVSDEIRQSLASPRAQIKMKKMLDTVAGDMERYFQDRTLWEMDIEDQPDLPAPPMPDFAGVVDGNQAVMGEVALTDSQGIEEHELGQAFDIAIYSRENIQRVTFANAAYTPSAQPYQPSIFPKLDMATDRYVYWMTEKTDEYIPELDEVRSQVVEACKRERALDVAKQEATTLAAKAQQSDKPLQESLSGGKYNEFVDTGEVSWVTAPMQEDATPSITPINGAEDAGPELRKKLFSLSPGEVGFAQNMPKDKVYLFRVAEETPSAEIRREQFLKNGVGAPVLFLARRDSMIGLSEWYRELTSKYGIDWQRDPKTDNGNF